MPGCQRSREQKTVTAAPVLAGQRAAVAALPGLAREPECAAELTEIRVGGQAWSLEFEATGPASPGERPVARHLTEPRVAGGEGHGTGPKAI